MFIEARIKIPSLWEAQPRAQPNHHRAELCSYFGA